MKFYGNYDGVIISSGINFLYFSLVILRPPKVFVIRYVQTYKSMSMNALLWPI